MIWIASKRCTHYHINDLRKSKKHFNVIIIVLFVSSNWVVESRIFGLMIHDIIFFLFSRRASFFFSFSSLLFSLLSVDTIFSQEKGRTSNNTWAIIICLFPRFIILAVNLIVHPYQFSPFESTNLNVVNTGISKWVKDEMACLKWQPRIPI